MQLSTVRWQRNAFSIDIQHITSKVNGLGDKRSSFDCTHVNLSCTPCVGGVQCSLVIVSGI